MHIAKQNAQEALGPQERGRSEDLAWESLNMKVHYITSYVNNIRRLKLQFLKLAKEKESVTKTEKQLPYRQEKNKEMKS